MPYLKIDNQNLWFKKTGSGNKVFILLHNAGGDHQFLAPQADYLENIGTVISVDFFGHGKSDMINAMKLSIEAFASNIKQLIEHLKLGSNICLIGLNYGANVALELCYKHPSIAKELIMIDPPILVSYDIRKLITDHIEELGELDPKRYAAQLIEDSFISVSESVKKFARDVFEKTNHIMLKQLYQNLLDWDEHNSKQIISSIHTQCVTIMTDASLCDLDKLQNLNNEISYCKVLGSKYWATIEVPDQVNRMITRALNIFN